MCHCIIYEPRCFSFVIYRFINNFMIAATSDDVWMARMNGLDLGEAEENEMEEEEEVIRMEGE